MAAAWVEARCGGGHLWFRLDPERGVIEVLCNRRSCAHAGPAVHRFDARTGALLDDRSTESAPVPLQSPVVACGDGAGTREERDDAADRTA